VLGRKHRRQRPTQWFVFGDKGDNRRVFGVFSSRVGAQDAVDKLVSGRLGEQYRGTEAPQRYADMLAEAGRHPAVSDKDKGIDR
jgi:hypothetical protein